MSTIQGSYEQCYVYICLSWQSRCLGLNGCFTLAGASPSVGEAITPVRAARKMIYNFYRKK